MSEYILFSSPKIILSYKPLITTDKLLVYRGKVIAYGLNAEKKASAVGAEKRKYNYVLAPGFIDTHMHIDTLAFMLRTIDLSKITSMKELAERILIAKNSIGEWIVGRGFDHNLFIDNKIIDKNKLDSFIPDHPILLIHKSGHMGFLNTAGIERLKTLLETLPKDQVDLEKGILVEDALWKTYSWIKSRIKNEDFINMILEAQNYILRHGVTTIAVAGCDEQCMEALLGAERSGEMRIRVYVYIYPRQEDWVEEYYRWRDRTRGNVSVLGIKLLADGALGTRTAYLSTPYNDEPSNCGKLLLTHDEIRKYVKEAVKIDAQVAIHAIGDAALDEVLKAYYQFKQYRHLLRIEHASLVRDDQLEMIRKIKPLISVQPRFIVSDKWIMERIGYRVKWAYRFRSLMERTIISFSTDCPVEPIDPRDGLYCAVTRDPGSPYEKYTLNEKLELIDALHLYTRTASFFLRDHSLGALLPGCYADIIGFNKDPLMINTELIRSIRIYPVSINNSVF